MRRHSKDSKEPSRKPREPRPLPGFFSDGKPEGWVEVATAPNQIAAGMLESALKAEVIPVIINRPWTFAITGGGGIHGIMVPEDRAEEAREILRDIWDVDE